MQNVLFFTVRYFVCLLLIEAAGSISAPTIAHAEGFMSFSSILDSRGLTKALQQVEKLKDQQQQDATGQADKPNLASQSSVPLPGTNGSVRANSAEQQAVVNPTSSINSSVAPIAVQTITGQQATSAQSDAVAAAIKQQIDDLQAQINQRLSSPAMTPAIAAQIDALNDTLSAKRQAYDLALGRRYADVSVAAAESYAATANPYFLMCGASFWTPQDPAKWSDLIATASAQLIADGRSVGILTIDQRPAGTAIAVGSHHILTNLHVAKLLADHDDGTGTWSVRPNVMITFDKEYSFGPGSRCPTPNQARSYYVNAVYGVAKNGDDIAVLMTSTDGTFPPPLAFKQRSPTAYAGNMTVAVIGYPGPPEDMTATEQIQFFHTPLTATPQFAYKRLSEGFTGDQPVGPDGFFVHRANTAGGNSGSPVIDIADGSVVGLHVQGHNRFRDSLGYNQALTSDRVNSVLAELGLIH